MKRSLRLLAALNAVFLLSALGCGDEDGGGCGPAPAKEQQQSSGGGSGYTGSASRGGDIIISDKKGRVPKAYQRPTSTYEPAKQTAPEAPARAPVRVIRRNVDGIAERIELQCQLMAAARGGRCADAPNYEEIKQRCCPGGFVERCKITLDGIMLVGRGCDPATR